MEHCKEIGSVCLSLGSLELGVMGLTPLAWPLAGKDMPGPELGRVSAVEGRSLWLPGTHCCVRGHAVLHPYGGGQGVRSRSSVSPMAASTEFSLLPCGFINAANRYLSAEPFRFQVMATSSVLRPSQIWTLSFTSAQGAGAARPVEGGQPVHLLSSLKRFLAADANGKVTCKQESPNSGCLFLLWQYPDGKVSLQCEATKRYLGGAEDNITCFAQAASEGEKWSLHLALHPTMHVQSPGKQRYLRCDTQTGRVRCDRDLPWGADAIFTLHFDLKEKKYGLRSGAGSMLAADGSLVDGPSAHSLYTLELQGGLVALRDVDGKYLTDRESAVKTFKIDRPGHDELFALEPSPALVSLRTFSSGRYVCCRPGADVYANTMSVGNTELFQLLLNDAKQACFRSFSGAYLATSPSDGMVSCTNQSKQVWFELQYKEQQVTLKAVDGRYVALRPNGQILLLPEGAGKKEKFLLLLVNRPQLILQSEAGFVGRSPGTQRLDGNRPAPDVNTVTLNEDGFYHFRIANKYWSIDKNGLIMVNGDQGSNFTLQFVASGCLAIKAPNNKYLVAEGGGRLWTGTTDVGAATRFHF
ncbi:fascin [Alligator mississippiensis]|nr:fascin [Alligator mississippiensis]